MKLAPASVALLLALSATSLVAGDDEGWIPLLSGRDLSGWKAGESPSTFRVEDGELIAHGPRGHLFYVGEVAGADFRNFELRAEVKTWPGANSGIFFHTAFQDRGWLSKGYEVQINNTYEGTGSYRELKKTGSLYAVRNVYSRVARDGVWFPLRIRVEGKRIRVWVHDLPVVDYVEPENAWRPGGREGRRISRGTFAIQGHDPGSRATFRSLDVRILPDDAGTGVPPRTADETELQITRLHAAGFPLVDFHVHLKGGLTMEEAIDLSARTGINYGIVPNCGIGFPIESDRQLREYLTRWRDVPVFHGMQAEGREWVDTFSPGAIAEFDYVFTDSMTFRDDVTGKRMRLWIDDEVEVRAPEEFMEMLVGKIERIVTEEPIDIYVNPTFLPRAIAKDYDELWTEERMDRVVAALRKGGVAMEINSRYRLPSIPFIRKARAAGVRFAFGTNNGGRDLGRLEYCLRVVEECGLRTKDMFLPRSAGEKAIEETFRGASASARIAGYSLSKVERWLHEVALHRIDAKTGLYIADGRWNYRDTAADCYPFLVWAAWAVDPVALDGPVRSVLRAEQRLCNHAGRVPRPYDLKSGRRQEISHDELVFQASEYVKDGLIAIVEVTGRDEWFERMRGIEDDLWSDARVDTPFGKVVSRNIEVNGEQIQALVRLFSMTGEARYLDWAERLADWYLADESFVPSRLRDHGCEIIGGIGLLLAVESEARPERARRRLPRVRRMLDEILARGLNPDGLMLNTLAAEPAVREGALSDGWGYNYVGYLCHDLIAGEPVFRSRIESTLRSLAKPAYRGYRWEGSSIDGYADSIEGAIYLLNRLPVAEGLAWVDREMADHVARSAEPLETARLWGTMKLESNGVRTVLMHALMHTGGLRAHPWKRGLELGAREVDGGLAIVVRAPGGWQGRLLFDRPRHREFLGFGRDWPRMNTLPEWFTVEDGRTYRVVAGGPGAGGTSVACSGASLRAGLSVAVRDGEEARLLVTAE